MNCFTIDLPIPRSEESAELIAVCCLHIGHKGFDYKRALKWRSWILEGKNRFAINLGDDIENAVPGDENHNSMMWDSNMHPEEQYRKAAEYWEPVVMAKKLIMTHNSNHFWRSEAKTGISIPQNLNVFLQGLTADLKTPTPLTDVSPRWGNWQALSQLNVGKQVYTVHSWHGSGNGCTPEAALRKCRSMAVTHRADLFLMGHSHQKIAWSDNYMVHAGNGREAHERQRMFAVTGGYLGWHGTYAERMGLPPNRRGSIVVRLGAKQWDLKVSI
jgi:hypothetical protein